MGNGDLGEASFGGKFSDALFVKGIAIAVHEDDRAGPNPIIVGCLKLFAQNSFGVRGEGL